MSTPDAVNSDLRPPEKLTHGNYHTWAPRATARLMELGVWRSCTGDEVILQKPVPPITTNATPTEMAALNYKDDTRQYNESMRRNDRAIGTISNLIESDQFVHIEGKMTAKEAWDTLKAKHANTSRSGSILHQSRYADENVH